MFWALGAFLVTFGFAAGGWARVIPGAVLAALAAFAADLYLHRNLVAVDRDLWITLGHVLSAAAVAASTLYWAGTLLAR